MRTAAGQKDEDAGAATAPAPAASPQVPAVLALQQAAGNRAVGRMLAREVPSVGGTIEAGLSLAVRGVGDYVLWAGNMGSSGRAGDDLIEYMTESQGDPVKTALFVWYRHGNGQPYQLSRAQVIESYRHHGQLNLFRTSQRLYAIASQMITDLASAPIGTTTTKPVTNLMIGVQANDALGVHGVDVTGTLTASVGTNGISVDFEGTLSQHDWWDFDSRLGEMAMGTGHRPFVAETAVGIISDVVRGQPFTVTSERVGVRQNLHDDAATLIP